MSDVGMLNTANSLPGNLVQTLLGGQQALTDLAMKQVAVQLETQLKMEQQSTALETVAMMTGLGTRIDTVV